MKHRMNELEKNEELERLVKEQYDDMSTRVLYPETITPLPAFMLDVENITVKERASIILSAIGRINNGEIAKALGCTEGTVRYYLRRGYKKLQDRYTNGE